MTSVLAISRLTGRPAGRWRSLAVTMPSSGYWNSHHHWCPITFDAEGVLRRRGLRPEDRRHGREGDERQDDRRDECPDELEHRAAPDLPGGIACGVALPEPEDGDQEQDLHARGR